MLWPQTITSSKPTSSAMALSPALFAPADEGKAPPAISELIPRFAVPLIDALAAHQRKYPLPIADYAAAVHVACAAWNAMAKAWPRSPRGELAGCRVVLHLADTGLPVDRIEDVAKQLVSRRKELAPGDARLVRGIWVGPKHGGRGLQVKVVPVDERERVGDKRTDGLLRRAVDWLLRAMRRSRPAS
jgi:hypothetical protein